MKDSFFELLLNLFEKTLSEIKESSTSSQLIFEEDFIDFIDDISDSGSDLKADFFSSQKEHSMRIFTAHEQMKLTKASYQFLVRMLVWGVIHPDTFEIIINQLVFSEARIVTLEETKWTVRNVLAELLDDTQLEFLDLVLYQKEERYIIH